MADLEKTVEKAALNKGRKRKKQPESWEKFKQREKRYAATDLPTRPNCTHTPKTYKCRTLSMGDVLHIHKLFYLKKNKIYQNNFILKYCKISKCQRNRPKTGCRTAKNMSVAYFLPQKSLKKEIRVCKSALLSILKIKKDRVTGVLKRSHKTHGGLAQENRGGDHRSRGNVDKRSAINNFIQSFKCTESHYCRGKSACRVYLSSDLNIKKMWHLYNDQASAELKVKQSFFRNELNINYNVGFGTPRTDVCSRCTELLQKIKTSPTLTEKQEFITLKRIHSLKAKAFYEMLRDDSDNVFTMSFDCQKNMMLPKLPDQAAYFSRQYNFYNFSVVVGTSKSPLNNVLIYYWNEAERPKGCNEIASAVFHALNTVNISQNVTILRMFADGCGGQNKNTILIGMCAKWLFCNAPRNVKKIEIIFPVVGHSFLPPDRVFAKIEKEIRKKEVITNPQQYVNLLGQHGKPFHLSKEVAVCDWKATCTDIIKPPGAWHFRFNPSKRFFLWKGKTDVYIQGEEMYRSEINQRKVVTKKGKTINQIEPIHLDVGKSVKKEKVKDVCKLLEKHYGDQWRRIPDLQFYVNTEQELQIAAETNAQDDQVCEPIEENENFI